MLGDLHVRKHRAPNGALRHEFRLTSNLLRALVRKHRAPKGALRLAGAKRGIAIEDDESESTERQTVH